VGPLRSAATQQRPRSNTTGRPVGKRCGRPAPAGGCHPRGHPRCECCEQQSVSSARRSQAEIGAGLGSCTQHSVPSVTPLPHVARTAQDTRSPQLMGGAHPGAHVAAAAAEDASLVHPGPCHCPKRRPRTVSSPGTSTGMLASAKKRTRTRRWIEEGLVIALMHHPRQVPGLSSPSIPAKASHQPDAWALWGDQSCAGPAQHRPCGCHTAGLGLMSSCMYASPCCEGPTSPY
jgi:hypothetical protein